MIFSKRIPRGISIFTLAMINIAAVGSVRNWPTIAEYGFAALFFLIIAALIFFIPVAMVAAELATGWPKTGGVFEWVKEAFSHRWGFLAIWLLWIENVIYYPTMLSFIAATLAYLVDPILADNPWFTLSVILGVFWIMTFINLLGMRTSGWVSVIGVIGGTIIPGVLIVILGILWYISERPMEIRFSFDTLIPNMSSPRQLVFFSGVLLALAGLEMPAVHARDVENPKKNYPRAILLSAILILLLYILGVLSIALVVPQQQISLVAGSMQAFSIFVNTYGLKIFTPIMAGMLVLGALGTLSTWIAGPSKGLLGAAQSGELPPIFHKVNRYQMPVVLLISQGIIVSFVSMIFFIMPTVSAAYWILNAMVSQLYLIMYILMFAAAIRLRYKQPDIIRTYRIPGGNYGMWCIAGIGILASLGTLFIGFFPPEQIATGNTFFYVSFLILGIILISLVPFFLLLFKKDHWTKKQ